MDGASLVESASRLPDPMLRTLDAIHVATALLIREDVDVLVSYDKRMLAAARHGPRPARLRSGPDRERAGRPTPTPTSPPTPTPAPSRRSPSSTSTGTATR